MVHSFLLPEVEKRSVRQKGMRLFIIVYIIKFSYPLYCTVQNDQRKHLLAAHKIILETIGNISQGTEQVSSTLYEPATGASFDSNAKSIATGGMVPPPTLFEEINTNKTCLPEVRVDTASTSTKDTGSSAKELLDSQQNTVNENLTNKQVPHSEAAATSIDAIEKEVPFSKTSVISQDTTTLPPTSKQGSPLSVSEDKDETATSMLSGAKEASN